MTFNSVDCSFKTEFNWSNSFTLSWVNKVTTGAWSSVSVIANVPAPVYNDASWWPDYNETNFTIN